MQEPNSDAARADRMRLDDLPVIVLQQIRPIAVQHARPAAGQACRVLAGIDAVAVIVQSGGADKPGAMLGASLASLR